MTDATPPPAPERGAPRGVLGVIARTLVRLALFALAVVLWQTVGYLVESWMARASIEPLGPRFDASRGTRWHPSHHVGYALSVLAMGVVALTATLWAVTSLLRETVDGWLGGLRRRFARENWLRTDGPPWTANRFQRMAEDLTALAGDRESRRREDEPPRRPDDAAPEPPG